MKVSIKSFDIEKDVKSKGIVFEVRDTKGKRLGDCYVTMTGLIWCRGKTRKENGKEMPWKKFIATMEKIGA